MWQRGSSEKVKSRRGSNDPHKEGSRTRPSVLVSPENLQATFENLLSVISSGNESSFSRDTVRNMLESVYEWMVFDKSLQIVIPSAPGSQVTRKMWPQGSRVDTRKKRSSSLTGQSPLSLKDVSEDHASTVASSVVSSTIDEEMKDVEAGVVCSISSHPVPPARTMAHLDTPPALRVPLQSHGFPSYAPEPQTRPDLNIAGGNSQQALASGAPQKTQGHYASNDPQRKTVPRYSIAGRTVDVPIRVQESPQQNYALPVQRQATKKTRKTKVGVSPRQKDNEADGVDFTWAD